MSEENDLLATLSALMSDSGEDEKTESTEIDKTDSSPFDMDMIIKLGSVFSELNTDDERVRILRDLKPFLSAEKHEKVEQSIKILKLLKIAEKAKNEKLF